MDKPAAVIVQFKGHDPKIIDFSRVRADAKDRQLTVVLVEHGSDRPFWCGSVLDVARYLKSNDYKYVTGTNGLWRRAS